jgi:CheY-like chemotaxis protein
VRVTLESDDEAGATLRISVKDSGVGIPKDKQDIIFEAFSQADGSTTRKYGGTGLGLAISTDLVEMMGGKLGVESEPGKGATFSFTARFSKGLRGTTGHYSIEVPTGPPPRLARKLDVLVADDNEINRVVLQRYLEREGHRPTLVVNGKEAVALAGQEGRRFDVVLMDIQMQEMDGFQAANEIRSAERESGRERLPIVAVTAHAMKGDRERCLQAGFDEYITKPVSLDTLVSTLSTLFRDEPAKKAAAAAFDQSGALARAGGDESLLTELVGIFLTEVTAWLKELDVAVAAEDKKTVHRVAHTLKGAAAQCGVSGAFDPALALETLAKQDTFDKKTAELRLAALHKAIEAALPAMRALSPSTTEEKEAKA